MLTGSLAEAGRFTVNGLSIAQEEINQAGGVLGRKLELSTEDNGSTNPGTVLAFSKLFNDPASLRSSDPSRALRSRLPRLPSPKRASRP